MILSGVGWVLCATVKETYAPVILQKKAARIRKETGDHRYWSRYDQKLSGKYDSRTVGRSVTKEIPVWNILKVNLSRPFVLTFTEPILWFWDVYIGVSLTTS